VENRIDPLYYQSIDQRFWDGRRDGETESHLRWHQVVRTINFASDCESLWKGAHVLLGFCCDEGVRRNQGRVGAVDGPGAMRKVLRNLPVHHSNPLYDAGNVVCEDGNLERAQEVLADAITLIIRGGGLPIVLGGGHEVTYGHFKGLHQYFGQDHTVGIINFDAHFDLRVPLEGRPTSGTGFYQIAQDLHEGGQQMAYMAIGIQEISNTRALFETAAELGVEYILADELRMKAGISEHLHRIAAFIERCDVVYLTVDLDVFAAAYAPGVSATAFSGIVPDDIFLQLFRYILDSGKLVSMDIAELNPRYDLDDRTAKLAADLVFKLLSKQI